MGKKGVKKVSEATKAGKPTPDPAEGGGKVKPVRIELSEEQHALLDRLLEDLGNPSRGAFFRMLLIQEAKRRGFMGEKETK